MVYFAIFSFLLVCGSCEVEVLGNAKNVILVIANGMTSTSVTSARIQEARLLENSSHILSFETFPHHGLLKTYDSEFKPGNIVSDHMPLFYGTYNQSKNFHDESSTLFISAHKNKKSIGVVTTVEMENLLSTFKQIGLSNCPESNKPNCSHSSCYIPHGCFGIDPDIIVGRRSGHLQLENTSCDCFHNYRQSKTEFETHSRMYLNNTEEFNKVEPKDGVKLIGLFSVHDFMENHPGGKLGLINITNVVEKSIKILRNNPNGYFLVVIVNYDDPVKTVKVASALTECIKRAISMKDTMLVVTSDISYLQRCEDGNIKNELFEKGVNSSTANILAVNRVDKNATREINSSAPGLATTSSNFSSIYVKSHCAEDSEKRYVDVPVYTYGPYPSKMPAVQDQASFGLKIMKMLEEKHYEDIKFNSEIGELDSDMFHKDIKAAMAEIDEMTKELFSDWL